VVVRDFGRSAENTQEVALGGWLCIGGPCQEGQGKRRRTHSSRCLVASFRDGKAVKLGYYNDQTQALEAVGLRE
jgi:hypothetical protein